MKDHKFEIVTDGHRTRVLIGGVPLGGVVGLRYEPQVNALGRLVLELQVSADEIQFTQVPSMMPLPKDAT